MKLPYALTAAVLMAFPSMLHGQTTSAVGSASGSAALEATVAAGLPEAPVRDAIARSQAREETAAQTERAALASYTELSLARAALTREPSDAASPSRGEIVAGAQAIAGGAATADLETVRAAAPAHRDLTASLNALASLEAKGIGGAQAASAIAARLESGASDRAIAGLATGVRSTADLSTLGGASAAQGALDAAVGIGGALGGLGATAGVGASVAGSLGGIIR